MGERRIAYRVLVVRFEGRDHLVDIGINGSMMLK
jgi:hypothetical protein